MFSLGQFCKRILVATAATLALAPVVNAGEPGELDQGLGTLDEHREIGGAAHHRLQHPQHPIQGEIR